MSTETESTVEDIFATGEVNDGENLFQTDIAGSGGKREYEYRLTSFIPTIHPDAIPKTGVPDGAGHFVIPDLRAAKIVRVVRVFQTTTIPKVPLSFNMLFLNVNKNNWPNPTPLQDAIWRTVISERTTEDGLAKTTQAYLVPVINLYQDDPGPSILDMTANVYNALVDMDENSDAISKGRTNLTTNAVYVWKIRGTKGEAKCRFDMNVDAEEVLAQYGELPDVTEYVKMRSKATEEYFKGMYAVNSMGHRELETETWDQATEFANMAPNLTPDQLKAVFSRVGIKFPVKAQKMALLEIANDHSDDQPLFDAVKEIYLANPPF